MPRGEVVDGSGRFDPGKSTPGNHESQDLLAPGRIGFTVAPFKSVDHTIANPDRVRERLEVESQLLNILQPQIVG